MTGPASSCGFSHGAWCMRLQATGDRCKLYAYEICAKMGRGKPRALDRGQSLYRPKKYASVSYDIFALHCAYRLERAMDSL